MSNQVVYNKSVSQMDHSARQIKGRYEDMAVVGIPPVMKASPKPVSSIVDHL